MYRVYINTILMPVAPGRITIKTKNSNKTVSLADGGEINIPKSPGLSEISFDLLLPAAECPFAQYDDGFRPPDYYIEWFNMLKVNKRPFELVIIRSMTAEMLLKYTSGLAALPESVLRPFDLNGDGKVNSADARILLRSQGGSAVLSPTVMKCTVEDYTITEDAEKYGGDISVSLKLKQYREYGLKTIKYNVAK